METDERAGAEVRPVTLWSKVKGNCLDENPFISHDEEGREVVICPRCHQERPSMDYITFAMEPAAIPWLVPPQKCPNCHHIFAFVR